MMSTFEGLALLLLTLTAGVGTGFVSLVPQELVVTESTAAIFTCSPLYIVALPILERNGIVFHSSRLTFTDSNINSLDGQRQYRLSNVTREETGSILRCYMGGFFSNRIALTVVVLPTLSGPSGEMTLIEGDPGSSPTIFQYTVGGFPHPHTFVWLRDGAKFTAEGGVAINNNYSLAVQSPLRSDSANYTLRVESSAGNATISLLLKIVYNEFLESPVDTSLNTGSIVTLRCVHKFGRAYAWFSNQRPLYDSLDKVMLLGTGKTLVYGPVDYKDHQIRLYCIVEISATNATFKSSESTLTVHFPPVVLAPPPLTATESTDILLEFIVMSHPPPSHTNYLHEGRTLVGKHDIVDVGALLLKDVSRLGAGEYSLTVSNALGTGYNYTTLHILYSPVIVPYAGTVIAQIFMVIVLSCGQSYSGNPTPQTIWATNSSSLLDPRYHINRTTGELLISTVRHADTGVYECSAQNSIGNSVTEVNLLVLDPPSQPIDVTITAVGATWAVIIWSPPIAQGSCSVSSYLVTATPSMQPRVGDCVEVECKSVIVQIKSVSINISQLVPGVRHVLTVSALSNGTNLKSLPSKEVEVTTANSVPSIGHVNAVECSPGRCEVIWSLAYSGGSRILYYQIQYKRVSDSYWRDLKEPIHSLSEFFDRNAVQVPSSQRSWQVDGLESSTLYHIRVCPVSSEGKGEFIRTLAPVFSHQEGVPNRPDQPQVTCWTNDSVCITTSFYSYAIDLLVFALVSDNLKAMQVYANYNESSDIMLGNVTFRSDLMFIIIAVNKIGVSEASLPSIRAGEFVMETKESFDTAGPVIGATLFVINCIVMVLVVVTSRKLYRKTVDGQTLRTIRSTGSPINSSSVAQDTFSHSQDTHSSFVFSTSPAQRRNPVAPLQTQTPSTPLSSVTIV